MRSSCGPTLLLCWDWSPLTYIIVNRKLVSLGVAPVGTDPCDGVNLFAFFTIVFIAIGSTPRLFNSHYSSSPLRYLYVVRSQLAVLFAIFITFAAEIVALMRDPTAWIRTVLPSRLVALVCALAVVTVAAMLLIMFTQRNRISLSALRWTRTILPVVVATVGASLFVRSGQPSAPQEPRTSSPLLSGLWWSSSRCAFCCPRSC
jgi:hypothetical protein